MLIMHVIFFRRRMTIVVAMVMEIVKMLPKHMDSKITKKNYSSDVHET